MGRPRPRQPLTADQQPPQGAVAIPLTCGWCAWVDEADAPLVAGASWRVSAPGRCNIPHYAVRTVNGGRPAYSFMHTEIMGALMVDHRRHHDREKVVDNRRQNLRLATSTENARNARKHTPGLSSFKGVTKGGRGRTKWMARIRIAGRSVFLGLFRSDVRAALSYDEAAIRYFGEFAWTNFPREMQA